MVCTCTEDDDTCCDYCEEQNKLNTIPYTELKSGECSGPKSEDGKHKVWLGFTGDMWPAFCVNGCHKHAVDVPEGEYEDL